MQRAVASMLSALVLLSSLVSATELPLACEHPVYCVGGEGSILHVVQMARLYPDSKTFVDKPMNKEPEQVLEAFEELMQTTGNEPSREQVEDFVNNHFDPEGTEFEEWTPSDWNDQPGFLDNIQDSKYRSFASDIHGRWKDLGRQIRPDITEHPSRSSLIYLKEPFVVPGGRFREVYYWDSYWTILGLLLSEMRVTVQGMLSNFAYLVNSQGLIPNGNRVYFTRRSQPPLFIPMMEVYVEMSDDTDFLQQHMQALEKELDFWISSSSKKVFKEDKEHTLYVYDVLVDGPRPESYREDLFHAQHVEEQSEFYRNIHAACESGWDFSSRWFIDQQSQNLSMTLTDIKTRHILPVDLNAFLCRNARSMASFHQRLGNKERSRHYEQLADDIMEAIDAVLWNDEHGSWFDYDLINNKQRIYFFPSNAAPLWAQCYKQTRLKERIKPFVAYFKGNEGSKYDGGVPTSIIKSGQQWDFPNGWPPLQELVISGLAESGDPEAMELARDIASDWVANNFVSYIQSNFSIFEKYDVEQVGLPGGGGEYDVQEGFGWTNGVLLYLLNKYGDTLVAPEVNSIDDGNVAGNIMANKPGILALVLMVVTLGRLIF